MKVIRSMVLAVLLALLVLSCTGPRVLLVKQGVFFEAAGAVLALFSLGDLSKRESRFRAALRPTDVLAAVCITLLSMFQVSAALSSAGLHERLISTGGAIAATAAVFFLLHAKGIFGPAGGTIIPRAVSITAVSTIAATAVLIGMVEFYVLPPQWFGAELDYSFWVTVPVGVFAGLGMLQAVSEISIKKTQGLNAVKLAAGVVCIFAGLTGILG